jgi:nitrogen fixation protein NifQ
MSEPASDSVVASRAYARLMAAARNPADIATLALGGVLARFAIQDLDAHALDLLLSRYFPGTTATVLQGESFVGDELVCKALSEQEYGDLLSLLLDYRRDESEENVWVAQAMASACAGDNHLWQDMGLPSREVLSQLIRRYFPVLFHKNHSNMKWKKFFYKQLCERAEVQMCKAPSCGVCSDYTECFGSENV